MGIQMPTLWNAAPRKASGLQYLQGSNVIRIVGKHERLVSVMLEAISLGAYVFTDQIDRTVIAKKAPFGFKKVHAGMQQIHLTQPTPPEAA